MDYISLIFIKSPGIGAFFIRLFTRSRWNHVAIVLNSSEVIEAVGSGVRRRRMDTLMASRPEHEFVNVEVPNKQAGLDFLLAQVGKPYDYGAIWAFVFLLGFPALARAATWLWSALGGTPRDWQEDSKWFCCELGESTIVQAGRNRLSIPVSRLTPGMEYNLPAQYGPTLKF